MHEKSIFGLILLNQCSDLVFNPFRNDKETWLYLRSDSEDYIVLIMVISDISSTYGINYHLMCLLIDVQFY